jgi:cyclopentanol dehydrogenase
MRLEEKVALITGGARGMGATEAWLFAKEGAMVVMADVLEAEGNKVETEINQAGGQALFLRLDVTREEEWRKVVSATEKRFGKLDVVVNNAGIGGGVLELEDIEEELWDRVMDVNAKGVFFSIKHTAPALRRSGGGSIVNISSVAGMVGSWQGNAAYGASKAAVRLLTKNAALAYAKDGIRVNSIHPGSVHTPMTDFKYSDPKVKEESASRIPLGRVGSPEDIAYGALFLASDDSTYMTGSELVIDGGILAQ